MSLMILMGWFHDRAASSSLFWNDPDSHLRKRSLPGDPQEGSTEELYLKDKRVLELSCHVRVRSLLGVNPDVYHCLSSCVSIIWAGIGVYKLYLCNDIWCHFFQRKDHPYDGFCTCFDIGRNLRIFSGNLRGRHMFRLYTSLNVDWCKMRQRGNGVAS